MPQIRQLQVVHWGPLRSDPVELAIDGVNVTTGPNGSGKTCLLDAVKLILGITDLKAKPNEYIFDGGGDPARRAERSYIKAIFANPDRGARQGRVFADAGRGCERADEVTAICEITADRRRFALLPRTWTWGEAGRRLEEDLASLETLNRSDWYGPRQWSELLARAGVSRALLKVISVRQGETDKAIDGTPEELLRRVLELTGKQETMDQFRAARTKLAQTRAEYLQTLDRFKSEKRELDHLSQLASRHEEYVASVRRCQDIETIELPTAQRRKIEAELAEAVRDRDQRLEVLARVRTSIAELEAEIPELEEEVARLREDDKAATLREQEALERLNAAAGEAGAARSELLGLNQAVARAREVLNGSDPDEALAHASARTAAISGHNVLETETERNRLLEDLSELRAGRPLRPPGLDAIRQLLDRQGIPNEVVAETLELDQPVAGEAALGDGVWTIVVPSERLDETLRLAEHLKYRLPIAAAGPGNPTGVFATASGLDDALAYLEEVDVTVSDSGPGITPEGLLRSRTWGAYRAPEHPILGTRAREEGISRIELRLAQIDQELPSMRMDADRAGQASSEVAAGLDALKRVPIAEATVAEAEALRVNANERLQKVRDERSQLGPELGRKENELSTKRTRRSELTTEDHQKRAESAIRSVEILETQLRDIPWTKEQEALGDLPEISALEHELKLVTSRLEHFSEEERTEEVLALREEQAEIVARVEELMSGRKDDLDRVEAEVDEAKRRFDMHVRQTIHRLAASFREICSEAGMEGELELRPSSVNQEEFALEVRVAHNPGEPKRSYQHSTHSGGQRAKISILLLLAAMSSEGAADILIMDEHIAHLDSRNIDYVADVMSKLKSRVQFILATPTNAEAARLSWCDHQLAFFPREPGQPYAPPIRLITRLPEPDLPTGGEFELATRAD